MSKQMQTIIDQYFKTKDGRRLGLMRRTLNIDFVPILNASIEDTAWGKAKKINDVIINPTDHYYMLRVDDEITENVESFKEIVNLYEHHGWKII